MAAMASRIFDRPTSRWGICVFVRGRRCIGIPGVWSDVWLGSGLRVLAGIFRMDRVSILHDLAGLPTGRKMSKIESILIKVVSSKHGALEWMR
jgi:hypothetical protein